MKLIYTIAISLFFLSCKENAVEEDFSQNISIDLNNTNVSFQIKKVSNLTDSIYFEFKSTAMYDCDKYVINNTAQKINNKLQLTLGSIAKSQPNCTAGQFPAIGIQKMAALPVGKYGFFVKKGTATFDGELEVTATAYVFDWVHDLHCMEINPKVLNK
jgi:hypothetical protein